MAMKTHIHILIQLNSMNAYLIMSVIKKITTSCNMYEYVPKGK